jgi:hypothetical protein
MENRTQAALDAITANAKTEWELTLLLNMVRSHEDDTDGVLLSHAEDAVPFNIDARARISASYHSPVCGGYPRTDEENAMREKQIHAWTSMINLMWDMGDDYGWAATWACIDALYIVATEEARRASEPIDIG